jgi:hypothetical protein
MPSLHSSIPSHTPPPADLVSLIRAEFREMPCLSVTLAQAARLWNVDRRQCLDALETLTIEGFLHCSREMYLRSASHRDTVSPL